MKKNIIFAAAALPLLAMAEGKIKEMPETSKTAGKRFKVTIPNPAYHQKFFAKMTEKKVRHNYRFFIEDAQLSNEDGEKLVTLISGRNLSLTLCHMDNSGLPEGKAARKEYYGKRGEKQKELYHAARAKIKTLLGEKFDSFLTYDKNSSMIRVVDDINNSFIRGRAGMGPETRKALLKVLIEIRAEKGKRTNSEVLVKAIIEKSAGVLSEKQIELLPVALQFKASLPGQTLWFNQLPGMGNGIIFETIEKK